ncbi:glycosyltransferase [Promicromonospora sukumoe]|uniref:glycosyltransferase n=1 Tax=Promicromonospora sukumoe TaxID=88382 RepID=UPI003659A1AE
MEAVYLLPIRRSVVDPAELDDLAGYVRRLARILPVVVVDASPPAVRACHVAAWGRSARTVVPPGHPAGVNGKVVGVHAGLDATDQPLVVVGDDDVRYDGASLRGVLAALGTADLVLPQNVFVPSPWHARWDSARSLVNRAFGHDYGGTVAFRRSALPSGWYDPQVLFENLELERTVLARGGRVRVLDVAVPRRPPTVRHFAGQRVRQAYDSLAQPGRLLVELALAPLLAACALAGTRSGRASRWPAWALLGTVLGGAVALAEKGRRRGAGTDLFPRSAAVWAPLWVAERAVCVWGAVGWRLVGGVPYAGARLRVAAHSAAELRRRCARGGTSSMTGHDRPAGPGVSPASTARSG